MNFRVVFFMIFCTFTITLNAQTEYPTESENDLFWQPNVQISFSHFQEKADTACIKYYENYQEEFPVNTVFSI